MTQEKMSSEVIEIKIQGEQEGEKQEIHQQQSSAAVVERHYTRPNLENTILTALRNAGKNVDQLTVDDLAPIDEFHTRGREATAELEEETGGYQQLSFSRATKKNHDTLAELEKQFVQWRMLSPRIEEEAAGRMGLLTELSKEIGRGGQLHE